LSFLAKTFDAETSCPIWDPVSLGRRRSAKEDLVKCSIRSEVEMQVSEGQKFHRFRRTPSGFPES